MSKTPDPKVISFEAAKEKGPKAPETTTKKEETNALEDAIKAAAERKRKMEEDRKRRNQRLADDTKRGR